MHINTNQGNTTPTSATGFIANTMLESNYFEANISTKTLNEDLIYPTPTDDWLSKKLRLSINTNILNKNETIARVAAAISSTSVMVRSKAKMMRNFGCSSVWLWEVYIKVA